MSQTLLCLENRGSKKQTETLSRVIHSRLEKPFRKLLRAREITEGLRHREGRRYETPEKHLNATTKSVPRKLRVSYGALISGNGRYSCAIHKRTRRARQTKASVSHVGAKRGGAGES